MVKNVDDLDFEIGDAWICEFYYDSGMGSTDRQINELKAANGYQKSLCITRSQRVYSLIGVLRGLVALHI